MITKVTTFTHGFDYRGNNSVSEDGGKYFSCPERAEEYTQSQSISSGYHNVGCRLSFRSEIIKVDEG